MSAYAGMPEDAHDRSNAKTDACGCAWVRVALGGNPWRLMRPCDEHQDGAA